MYISGFGLNLLSGDRRGYMPPLVKNKNKTKVLLLILYSSMKKIDKFGWIDFENLTFSTFGMLKAIQINLDEKIIGVELISQQISSPCSLFGPKLRNYNYASWVLHT